MNKIKDIKANFVNGMITSDDMVEAMEDLIHDVEGNDGMDFMEEYDEHYDSFENIDFTQLDV